MFTLFSKLKSLRGHCEVIQQNAILSVPVPAETQNHLLPTY
jgi:hypothetical protein